MDGPEDHQLITNEKMYSVGGFQLHANADSPDLLHQTQELLGSFNARNLAASAWQLVMERAELDRKKDEVAGLEEIWSDTLPSNLRAVNSVGPGRRRIELLERGRLDLDLQTRKATLTLAPDVSEKVAHYFLMPLLCEGLIQSGNTPVHAASLAVTFQGESRSVLIVAKSGTGKSTSSLALANSGWKLMGDDLCLISQKADRLLAWGFPRVCHVRRPTLALLPWLNELPLVPTSLEGTYDLPMEGLGARAYGTPSQPLAPALIVVLDRPNPHEHRLEPLDRATALVALSEENVQPIEGCGDLNAQTAFSRFAQLVQQTPAVKLSAGPQLDSLANFLSAQTGVGR